MHDLVVSSEPLQFRSRGWGLRPEAGAEDKIESTIINTANLGVQVA